MPLYEFEDAKTGEDVEVFFHMDEVCDFGEVVTHAGRKIRRVVRLSSNAWVDHGGQSLQAPKWDPMAPRHDKKGRPQFNNKGEAREYARKYNARLGGNANFHALDVE